MYHRRYYVSNFKCKTLARFYYYRCRIPLSQIEKIHHNVKNQTNLYFRATKVLQELIISDCFKHSHKKYSGPEKYILTLMRQGHETVKNNGSLQMQ